MAERTSVVDLSGNHEESLLQWAKHLGTSKIRRKLFGAVYGRGARPRSKKQLMRAAGLKETDAQQAQNELDHLSKHHLIVRVENDGSVEDRSRYLYKKDPGVRANRSKIVRYAENPKAARKVPTKRRPAMRGLTSTGISITRQVLRQKSGSMFSISLQILTKRIRFVSTRKSGRSRTPSAAQSCAKISPFTTALRPT